MYASCLFCNSALGSNECIEHFPVGRRLAFDAATGRLWVVCPKCERWNLSPLETRWEAIEEAERAFRGTKMRVSTDNIGLCRLPDGTELVRIGKPLRPEFAAWRYGDRFLRRQRRFILTQSSLSGMSSAMLSLPIILALVATPLPAAGAALIGSAVGGLSVGAMLRRRERRHTLSVRADDNQLLFLSRHDARCATLSPAGHAFEWQLNIPTIEMTNAGAVARAIGVKESVIGHRMAYLRDENAKRVLATILPHINMAGGGKSELRDAVELLDNAPNVHYLLHKASITAARGKFAEWLSKQLFSTSALHDTSTRFDARIQLGGQRKPLRLRSASATEVPLGALPHALRLALEMALHEDDERRAMQGELAELERRWRDAEVIAKIADEMLTPSNVQLQLDEMREQKPR